MIYRTFPNFDFTFFTSVNSCTTASPYEIRARRASVGYYN